MSYDDGVGADIRLMKIMKKNGIKGTFNISAGITPSWNNDNEKHPTNRMSLNQIAENYRDFEIATHGYTHVFLGKLPATTVIYEIVKDRELLEPLFKRPILGHAYPVGSYSFESREALRACGIIYARTCDETKSFDVPDDFLEYHPTAHHNFDLDSLYDDFISSSRYCIRPKLFTLWGHSNEFETDGTWEKIEKFLEKMGKTPNVWFAGLQEIVEYVNAYKSLIYSIDGKIATNPTALDVWVATSVTGEENSICIPAGKTVVFD
jgi:peptidoglycan/xylan/chitin deacetylase (PgdA/CDA1 family)